MSLGRGRGHGFFSPHFGFGRIGWTRSRAEARQSSPLRIVLIRDFAKALRQGAARATLLGDRRPKPRHDVGAEPPLQLFHDKPSLQNHLLKTGMRGI